MTRIAEMAEKEKQRYLEIVRKNAGRKIIIFGAGRQAKPLQKFLKENGIAVFAFCVSDGDSNKKEECGIPVVPLKDIPEEDLDSLFLLGVNPRLNKEVAELLMARGIKDYVESTEALRYIGNYQFDFSSNPLMEITTKMGCAINCKYCPQDVLLRNYFKTGKEARWLTFEGFKTCVDKMPQNTLIEFAGFTEPFLNPECLEMILYASERGHKVNLFTTLQGMTKAIFERIRNVSFEEFVLHIPDKENNSNIPITEEYLELLDVVIAAKKANGEDLVENACCHGSVPEIIQEHLKNRVRIFVSLSDRAGNLDTSDDKIFRSKDVTGRLRCELSETINHNILLPDGRVVLCPQDYGMKHVLGNLLEQSYENVMNSEEARRVKRCMDDCFDNSILCRNCYVAYTVAEEEEK